MGLLIVLLFLMATLLASPALDEESQAETDDFSLQPNEDDKVDVDSASAEAIVARSLSGSEYPNNITGNYLGRWSGGLGVAVPPLPATGNVRYAVFRASAPTRPARAPPRPVAPTGAGGASLSCARVVSLNEGPRAAWESASPRSPRGERVPERRKPKEGADERVSAFAPRHSRGPFRGPNPGKRGMVSVVRLVMRALLSHGALFSSTVPSVAASTSSSPRWATAPWASTAPQARWS